MGVRITMAWIVGTVLVLGSFNHAIVGRGRDVLRHPLRRPDRLGPALRRNLGIAIAGNLVGGLVPRHLRALGAGLRLEVGLAEARLGRLEARG